MTGSYVLNMTYVGMYSGPSQNWRPSARVYKPDVRRLWLPLFFTTTTRYASAHSLAFVHTLTAVPIVSEAWKDVRPSETWLFYLEARAREREGPYY